MRKAEANRLRNNTIYIKKLWSQEKIKNQLRDWRLILSSKIKPVGLCDYYNKTIIISTNYMRGHNCNYKKIKKVLMHEIAHAKTPGHSHDEIWKRKCINLGGDPRLAVTMVEPGMKWAMVCSTCKWRQEYKKQPYSKHTVCKKCQKPVRVKFIF